MLKENNLDLKVRLIESNVEMITYNVDEVLYRNDENHILITKEYDQAIGEMDNPLTWSTQWNVVTENSMSKLVELLSDYVDRIYQKNDNVFDFFNEVEKYSYNQGYLLVPITKMDHGSVNFYRGVDTGFDSGVCGFAYVAIDDVKRGNRLSKKRKDELMSEIDDTLNLYSQYCNGEIYLISIHDTYKNTILDSVGSVMDNDDINYYVDEFKNRFEK